jgi:hypothetical protein
MNRALLKRLLNEYLDGEIGLADKVELERLMAADPDVRREYKELRQIGLLLGGMPEVNVHSFRFRERVQGALDTNRGFVTPQRAFAGAMVVALVVISLSFSLLMLQQNALHGAAVPIDAAREAAISSGDYVVSINSGVTAERYFSRLLLQHELGMIDPAVIGSVVQQTSVFEGASCSEDALQPIHLANPGLHTVSLKVPPSVAVQMGKVAEELSGHQSPLGVYGSTGSRITLEEYLRLNPGKPVVNLVIKFD